MNSPSRSNELLWSAQSALLGLNYLDSQIAGQSKSGVSAVMLSSLDGG